MHPQTTSRRGLHSSNPVRRRALLFGVSLIAGWLALGNLATAADPPECVRARELLAAKLTQQAIPFIRACTAKQRANQATAGGRPLAPPIEAPLPSAAPTPASATSNHAPAADMAWLGELPTALAVSVKMEAGGQQNLQANQSYALHVLADYVTARAGQYASEPSSFPPVAQLRLRDYKSWTDDLDQKLGGTPKGSETDRRRVLGYFLSPASVSAYYALPAARAAGVSAGGKAIAQMVAKDQALAKAKGIDLSVFGVRLGEPLQFPECGDDAARNFPSALTGMGRGAPETCVGSAGADMATAIIEAAKRASGAKQDPTTQTVAVMLGESKCPGWVKAGGSCVLHVTLKEGIAVAASFAVSPQPAEADVLSRLREKFKAAPKAAGGLRCSNNFGASIAGKTHVWDVPGVHAVYESLGSDCAHGRVEMRSASYHQHAEAHVVESAASEPKM